MPSMSYCRWQNIRADFRPAYDRIIDEGIQNLSRDELKALKRVHELAEKLVQDVSVEDIDAALKEAD